MGSFCEYLFKCYKIHCKVLNSALEIVANQFPTNFSTWPTSTHLEGIHMVYQH